MPEVILSHTTGTKTEPTFLHQNLLPIQIEVRKELIVVKQSKKLIHRSSRNPRNSHSILMMIRDLVNKWSSHQQHKSSPLCHEQSRKVRLKTEYKSNSSYKKSLS